MTQKLVTYNTCYNKTYLPLVTIECKQTNTDVNEDEVLAEEIEQAKKLFTFNDRKICFLKLKYNFKACVMHIYIFYLPL